MGDRKNKTGQLADNANSSNTGVGVASSVLFGADVGSLILGTGAANRQSRQKQLALQQSFLTEELATRERIEAQRQDLNAVLSSQTAAAAARGFTLASPSFQAIQKRSLDAFAQDKFAETFNLSQREQLFERQKQDLIESNRFRTINSVFKTAKTLAKSISFNRGGSGGLPGGSGGLPGGGE